jgi:adenylosuccinate lyase
MMGLAPMLGRNEAHDLVYAACRSALANKTTLLAALLSMPEVAGKLDPEQLAALCDPINYLGCAGQMIDQALSPSAC